MSSNIAPMLLEEQRGRPSKYDFVLEVNEQREYPLSDYGDAQKLRCALANFRARNFPKWKFHTKIVGDKLLIGRIK